MTAPTGTEIAERLESVRNSVIDLLLIALLDYGSVTNESRRRLKTHCIRVRLGNTLGDHLGIASLVTRISTIFALETFTGSQKFLAERTQDGLIELRLNEFMPVHLVHVTPALSHGTLSTKTTRSGIQRPLSDIFFNCARKLIGQDSLSARRFQSTPTKV